MSEDGLTHYDDEGRPRMVDVTGKPVTARTAVAGGRITMARETLARIQDGRTAKGDPLTVAELAGVMGGKRTADLIPLCHQLPGVQARATARFTGRTGVEMEALTAVSVALLTVYDMLKAVDRDMRIEEVRLLAKEGGRSGTWTVDDF